MDLGLTGKVVLVTGAGGGAGPTLVDAFAAEGAHVAVHYRASAERAEAAAERIRAEGGTAIAVGADLDSTDAIGAMVATIERELGSVEVLVTATSAYRNDRLEEIGDDVWDAVVNDLLGATFRTCRAVAPGMASAGFGRIVNIAARSGLVGVAKAAHYAAAKAAIVGLTASLAKELGPNGVLVNAIAPTQILTHKDGRPSIPEDRQADLATSIPVRRLATPADLASVVLWLASAANTYVSGQTITLSGGAQT